MVHSMYNLVEGPSLQNQTNNFGMHAIMTGHLCHHKISVKNETKMSKGRKQR